MNNEFELIPAIDLKGGKCVRLQQGLADRSTEYSDDPVAMACYWQAQGAGRLHLVDLDGAFAGESTQTGLAARIFSALQIPVQFGGGLRTLAQVERILELGADRAILGSIAVEKPEVVEESVKRFGNVIVVAIDARQGMVALHGWVDKTAVTASALAGRMKALGVERVIYTDIARDGVLTGVNVTETAQLARDTHMRVLASGGVSVVQDLRALWLHREDGIEGAILGRALYENRLQLRDLAAELKSW